MVVCPQCHFENPNLNKFCQRCGSSLTHKHCHECGTTVPFNVLECPNCGTVTGTLYLAVISRGLFTTASSNDTTASFNNDHLQGASASSDSASESILDRIDTEPPAVSDTSESDPQEFQTQPLEEIFSETDLESITIPPEDALSFYRTSAPEPLEQPVGSYLDLQDRYQLLDPLPALKPGETVSVKVLDTQPLQVSPLNALQESTSTPSDAEVEAFILPAAQPYFALVSQAPSYFPRLQDAWQSEFYNIIILENFTDFPQLLEVWTHRNTPSQQIVDWLEDLVELWEILEPWGCRQSVLEIENLRILDQNSKQLCLQKLYFDPPDSVLTLSDLGQLLHELFQKSQRTLVGSLTEILRDLREGKIPTVEELKKVLTVVLDEINFPDLKTSFMAESQPSINQSPTLILGEKLIQIEAVGRTDVGRQRDHNEDCFGMETRIKIEETPQEKIHSIWGVYILCDGMGGHASGEVASQLAVDTLKHYFQTQSSEELPTEEILHEAILKANEAIYHENQKGVRSGSGRMGTTLVMAVVVNHQVAVAHVGDSRLYRLTRQQGLQQITLDHEVGQREIQRGIAYSRHDAYQLTQALGPREAQFIHPDIQYLDMEEDTVLILASDGLTDHNLLETFRETQLDPLLNRETDLATATDNLIALANQYNGHDNITAIVIRAWV
jgi:protein phosphatase